jgi:hypothetical protein
MLLFSSWSVIGTMQTSEVILKWLRGALIAAPNRKDEPDVAG